MKRLLLTLLLCLPPALSAQESAGGNAPVNGYITQFTAPPEYKAWYQQAERCIGKQGDFAAVEWFVVPGPWTSPNGTTYGEWRIKERHGDLVSSNPLTNVMNAIITRHHYIVINAQDWRDSMLVMHESIHDILWYAGVAGPGSHPVEYFNGICARPFYP